MNTALAATFKYLPKVIEYAKDDLGKRYSLLEDWEIRLKEDVPAPYSSSKFDIHGRIVRVIHYISDADHATCDGNTLVPEEVLGIPTEIGSLFHDPAYDEIEAIAAAFGWSVGKTRKWADTIYGNILLQLARRQEGRVARELCRGADVRRVHALGISRLRRCGAGRADRRVRRVHERNRGWIRRSGLRADGGRRK